MPPKGWRKYPDGFKPVNSSGTPVKEKENFKLDDLLLPKATIHRLASDALPNGSTVPSEGLLALRRSTAVFINYVSAEANTIAQAAGRKTIQSADILKALETVDLAQFLPSVRTQLEEYESYVASRKKAKKDDQLKEQDHLISDDEEKENGNNKTDQETDVNTPSKSDLKRQKVDSESEAGHEAEEKIQDEEENEERS